MAGWKKIIVSGSNASLNNLTVSDTVSASTVTSSNLNPLLYFDANRPVSNQDLPGLYNKIYTSSNYQVGDLTNFIETVFFTNTAPDIDPSQSFQVQEWTSGIEIGTTIGTVKFLDEEVTNVNINQDFNFTIEDNPFFEIVGNSGVVKLKHNVVVSKSMNTHPSESNGETILTYPLDVTVTDDVGESDTEKIYIHIIPNEKPVLTTNNGSTLTTIAGQFDEYGNEKVIYEFTASALGEASVGPSHKGTNRQIAWSDVNGDTLELENFDVFSADGTNTGDTMFEFDRYLSKIRLKQLTSSLDFESSSFFNLILTASDGHYPNPDTSSAVYLRYHIPVLDNPPPPLSDQNFLINENSPDGSQVIDANGDPSFIEIGTDTEDINDGTAFFLTDPSNFRLISAHKDITSFGLNITNSLFEIENSDYFKPTKDPFEVSIDGRITRKAGAFLNKEICQFYFYSASVTDIYNENQSSNIARMLIEVKPDNNMTFTHSSDGFIIESATVTGAPVVESHGNVFSPTETKTQLFVSSDETFNIIIKTIPSNVFTGMVVVQGSGQAPGTVGTILTGSKIGFRPLTNISGSDVHDPSLTFDNGSSIKVEYTASKTSFPSTITQKDFTVDIAKNNSPNIAVAGVDTKAFNEVPEGLGLYVFTFDDPENDSINLNSFTLTGPQPNTLTQLSSSIMASNIIALNTRNHLSASTTYNFTASIKDVHGFRSSSVSRSLVIGAKNTGTFNRTAGTYFLIESAQAGASVVADPSGRTGTAVSFSVDYSGGDIDGTLGTPTVQSFTASITTPQYQGTYPNLQDMFSISSGSIGAEGGLLTIKQNISKSNFNQGAQEGTHVTLQISYQDQYGNIGNSSVDVNPVDNLAPTLTETGDFSSFYTNALALNNQILKQYTISDLEGDTIESNIAITSSDSTNGLRVENNSSTLFIKSNAGSGQSLNAGTYHFTASIHDIHNFETSSVSASIVIASSNDGTLTSNAIDTHNGKPLFYIQECGVSNDKIHTEPRIINGSEGGSHADVGMSYTGGNTVTAFAVNTCTPDIDIDINSFGQLKLGVNISGSFTPSEIAGGTAIIEVPIVFTDSFSNQKTESIFVKVFQNASLGELTRVVGNNFHNGKFLFYLQECAEIGDPVKVGNGAGFAQADLGVDYNNDQGNPTGLNVASFSPEVTFGNSDVSIEINDASGLVRLTTDISGSVTPDEFITVSASFTDDGTSNVTLQESFFIKIVANDIPSFDSVEATGSTQSLPLNANHSIRTFKITDDEEDTPYTASLSGTDANLFYIDSGSNNNNDTSTEYNVRLVNDLTNDSSNQVLSYSLIIQDKVGKRRSNNFNTNFTLTPAKVMLWAWDITNENIDGSSASSIIRYISGNSKLNYTKPITGSIIDNFASGALKHMTDFVPRSVWNNAQFLTDVGFEAETYGRVQFKATVDLTDLRDDDLNTTDGVGLQCLGDFNITEDNLNANANFMIVFPSASNLLNKPLEEILNNSLVNTTSNTDNGKYIIYNEELILGQFPPVPCKTLYFNTSESVHGYNKWGLIISTVNSVFPGQYQYRKENEAIIT